MYCPNCNAENGADARFCVGCGAPLSAIPEQPAEASAPVQTDPAPIQSEPVAAKPAKEKKPPKEKGPGSFDPTVITATLLAVAAPFLAKVKSIFSNKKRALAILGGAVAVLAVCIICGIIFSGNGYIEMKQSVTYTVNEDGETVIIVDKKALKDTIDGIVTEAALSLDGKHGAFLTSDGQLYVLKGKKLNSVAEDVSSFRLAVNGGRVAFKTKEGELCLAKTSNGKYDSICDKISGDYFVSPDGKSVAYFEEGELKMTKGKKTYDIEDEDISLYGLSNSGKQIYVTKRNEQGETVLYSYKKNGDKQKLGVITSTSSIKFNSKHNMVMFEGEKGTYVSKNGKEATRVSGDTGLELITNGLNCVPQSGEYFIIGSADSRTYPVKNLLNHVYRHGNEVWMIKKTKDKSEKLLSKASEIQLDASAEYLYYVYDSKELRATKISYGDKASDKFKTIVDDYVGTYVVTSNRKYVYFKDGDELCCVNGKKGGTAKVVSDGVTIFALNQDDELLYIMDGDLYVTTGKKKGSKKLTDVSLVLAMGDDVVYVYSDDAVYASTTNKKPKKVYEL